MTQAEANAIRAEGQAQGLEVCICAEIVDAQPGLVDRVVEWLIAGLGGNEAEAG